MNSTDGALDFKAYIDNTWLYRTAAETEARIKGITSTVERESKQMTSSFSGMEKGLAVIGGTTALTFLGKQIIDTTAKFEKFGIVLRNTLGETKGNEALDMIAKFAATTPFQLDEVTDSFIRMANQGFVPTRDEMVKLGDLASSTGKGFNMLTEAILDAQTGEFERLKEFGIKASSNGDKVTFSFREQQTTVDKTNSSIRNYILSLGELNGIQGANELISKSMTGQISNLSDKFDAMFNQIGQANSGIIYSGLEIASELVENYETVGKVVLGLVGVYGAYKTAVLVTNAVDMLRTEIAYQQILANIGNTGTTVTLTTAEGVAAVAKSKLTAAQLALNASILANPYVAAVAAVVALSAAVYTLANRTTVAEAAQERLNSAMDEAKNKVTDEKSKITSLITLINDESLSRDSRNAKLRDLIALSPDHLNGLTLDSMKTAEGKKAIDDYVVSLEKKIKMQALETQLTESIKRAEDAKAGKENLSFWDKTIAMTKVAAVGQASMGAGAVSYADIAAEMSKTNNEEVLKAEQDIQESIKKQIGLINGVGLDKPQEKLKTVQEQILANLEAQKKAEEELKQMRSANSTSTAIDIQDQEKRIKDLKSQYEALTGKSLKNAAKDDKKEEDKAAKLLKEYEDAKLEAQKKASADEIALTRSQITDKKALIDFNLKQELDNIDELEKIYKKKAEAANVANPDTQMFDAMRTVVTKSADDKKSEINKELLSSFLANVVSNREKEKAINEKYDALQRALEDESRAYTEEERAVANDKIKAMRETDLQEVKISSLEQTESFKKMMSEMESGTLKALKKKKAEIDEYIKVAEAQGLDKNGEYYTNLKKDSDSVTKEIAKKTSEQYTELAYSLGDILSQSTDEMVQKMGSLLGQISGTMGTLGDSNASGLSKATSIVSLAITAGNMLKDIRVQGDLQAIEAVKARTAEVANQIGYETEINKLYSERQATQEKSLFLGTDYTKTMTNSMSDVAKFNGQLDSTMGALVNNTVFTAEGKAKRRLFGTKTGTYEFSLADVFGNNAPNKFVGNGASDLTPLLFGSVGAQAGNIAQNGGSFKDIAGSLLDPAGLFGGYADGKAKQNAFGNLQGSVNSALSAMGKSVGDFAKMSNEDLLTFYDLMEKSGNITDDGTKKLIASAKEQVELAKAAKEKFDGVITELAGGLGTSVKDILVEGFKGGFGYGVEQAKAVSLEISKILENMMSSIIYQAAFSQMFSELETGMKASYDKGGDMTWVDDFKTLYAKIPEASLQFNEGMKQAQDLAKQSGFDLWGKGGDSKSKGLEGAIKSITSDQANLIGGQMNAIRMNQAESLMIVRQQLLHMSEIAINTRYLKSIDAKLDNLPKATSVASDPLRAKGITA